VRNAAEKIAAAMKNCVVTAELEEIRLNRLSGMIGSLARLAGSALPPLEAREHRRARTTRSGSARCLSHSARPGRGPK
jgi:hypothetical protein